MYNILSTSLTDHRKADRCDLSILAYRLRIACYAGTESGFFREDTQCSVIRTARTDKGRVGNRLPANEARQWM